MSNAVRHAKPTLINVSLTYSQSHILYSYVGMSTI
jgi:signal transduction histidine kinase